MDIKKVYEKIIVDVKHNNFSLIKKDINELSSWRYRKYLYKIIYIK